VEETGDVRPASGPTVGEVCCTIMPGAEKINSTISHHLKVLRDAHLVTWEKRGLWVYYSLDRAKLEQATSYLNNLLSLSKVAVG